jgi:hypothetical protein
MSDYPIISTGADVAITDFSRYLESQYIRNSSVSLRSSTLSASTSPTFAFASANQGSGGFLSFDYAESLGSEFQLINSTALGSVDWKKIIDQHTSPVREPSGSSSERASKLLFGDRRHEVAPKIEVLAEWDGYVEDVHRDFFTARLRGLKGDGVAGKDEEAEVPKSDVDAADSDLIVPGAFFRLMITYESPKVGPRRRYTTVQFRRLPAFTQREIDAAEREADELLNGFRLDADRQSARS